MVIPIVHLGLSTCSDNAPDLITCQLNLFILHNYGVGSDDESGRSYSVGVALVPRAIIGDANGGGETPIKFTADSFRGWLRHDAGANTDLWENFCVVFCVFALRPPARGKDGGNWLGVKSS